MSNKTSDKLKYLHVAEEWKKKMEEDKVRRYWFNALLDLHAWFFNQMWDILKAIEDKYSIDVMTIAKKIRGEQMRQDGLERGKKAKRRGILGYYENFYFKYEGKDMCDIKYFEFNDERLEAWLRKCPLKPRFKALGKTDEEMAEMSELLCMDVPKLAAFDPELEVCQSAFILKGDDHCTYITRKFPKEKSKK